MSSSHEQCKKGIFNISMAPVLAFDLRQRGNVTSAKSMCRTCVEDQDDEKGKEEWKGGAKGKKSHVCYATGVKDPRGKLGL